MNESRVFTQQFWDDFYKRDITTLPWYYNDIDPDLITAFSHFNIIPSGIFLDLGTGPGTQARALSKMGFQVTATDISSVAIEKAASLDDEKLVSWMQDNILESKLPKDHFDYIFDRGCFHAISKNMRSQYVKVIHSILRDEGTLFLKTIREPIKESSEIPYPFTKEEIESIFGKMFEMQYAKETLFHGTASNMKAWMFVLKKKRKEEVVCGARTLAE